MAADPATSSFVQFPLGQVALLVKLESDGPVALIAATVSVPFLTLVSESDPLDVVDWVFTSTIWPPWFRHCTVAEYDTDSSTVASVLPTPEIAVPVQDTVRVD